jgi:hypothetical protein
MLESDTQTLDEPNTVHAFLHEIYESRSTKRLAIDLS